MIALKNALVMPEDRPLTVLTLGSRQYRFGLVVGTEICLAFDDVESQPSEGGLLVA